MSLNSATIEAIATSRSDVAKALLPLATETRKAAASNLLSSMPATETQGVLQEFLPQAPKAIWFMLLGGLFILSLAFGVMSYMLIANNRNAEALIALSTTTLGGIVGILAPSPFGK